MFSGFGHARVNLLTHNVERLKSPLVRVGTFQHMEERLLRLQLWHSACSPIGYSLVFQPGNSINRGQIMKYFSKLMHAAMIFTVMVMLTAGFAEAAAPEAQRPVKATFNVHMP